MIVGAGPIGLAYAWGIKKLNPSLEVVVLEKYAEYQRKHTLVMQHEQLTAIMQATGTQDNKTLIELVKQLKQDPHIRTNALETVFKALAREFGVTINIENVKKETAREQIIDAYPDVQLIIGADGTHSTISETLFPEGNQVKHEFDYVLQLRYEIKGDNKSDSIKTIDFYQHMARHGLVANEYVGNFSEGKTPVTMQMMISKKQFELLKSATSKDPIKLFSPNEAKKLPSNIKSFLSRYLEHKVSQCHEHYELIDKDSVRVSVNEAPATHAKQVVHSIEHNGRAIPVALVGDAGLGLSYFKGLNAGLESAAKWLTIMAPSIKEGFLETKSSEQAFHQYQSWFLNEFAPKKVNEVAKYSTWQIRSAMLAMKVVNRSKMASVLEDRDDTITIIDDYFTLLANDPNSQRNNNTWKKFPHRPYDPIKLGQFAPIPAMHTLKKIGKLFVDYFKSYKSTGQIKQDFKQPFVGMVNVGMGLLKSANGILTFDISRLNDGVLNVLRGFIELITTPLAWLIKPVSRSVITLAHYAIAGTKKIEDNQGIKKLGQYGHKMLAQLEINANNDVENASPQQVYDALAVCNDLHRKFQKNRQRDQASDKALDEYSMYSTIRSSSTLNAGALSAYFSLFSKAAEKTEITAGCNGLTMR